jgi:hypothetical protein
VNKEQRVRNGTVKSRGHTAYPPVSDWPPLFPEIQIPYSWPSSGIDLAVAASIFKTGSRPPAPPVPSFGGPDDFGEATVEGFGDVDYDNDGTAITTGQPGLSEVGLKAATGTKTTNSSTTSSTPAGLPTLGGPEDFGEAVVTGFSEVDYDLDGRILSNSLPGGVKLGDQGVSPKGVSSLNSDDIYIKFAALKNAGGVTSIQGLSGGPPALINSLPAGPKKAEQGLPQKAVSALTSDEIYKQFAANVASTNKGLAGVPPALPNRSPVSPTAPKQSPYKLPNAALAIESKPNRGQLATAAPIKTGIKNVAQPQLRPPRPPAQSNPVEALLGPAVGQKLGLAGTIVATKQGLVNAIASQKLGLIGAIGATKQGLVDIVTGQKIGLLKTIAATKKGLLQILVG